MRVLTSDEFELIGHRRSGHTELPERLYSVSDDLIKRGYVTEREDSLAYHYDLTPSGRLAVRCHEALLRAGGGEK